MRRALTLIVFPLLISAASAQSDQPTAPVLFMEPATSMNPLARPLYSKVEDRDRLAKYATLLENSAARRAFALYKLAWEIRQNSAKAQKEMPPYAIALVPGGNNADIGFRLKTSAGVKSFSKRPYIKLDPSGDGFDITFLHETGHVVLALLGADFPNGPKMASIPHSTAALTDRMTAFNEGFAIHLETLAAQLAMGEPLSDRYRHVCVAFGRPELSPGEFYRPLADLCSYSQTLARYYEVRENHFAFAEACREGDYLRVQLDKSRDFSTLREANQLLQSEGFYAGFFYAWTMRGDKTPDDKAILERQRRILRALAQMLAKDDVGPDTAYLLQFVRHYAELFPDERELITDAFLEITHGVFVDPEAGRLWKDAYAAAMRLEPKANVKANLEAARSAWRSALRDDFSRAYSRLGPQIRCRVPDVRVKLVILSTDAPLSFDINTVQPGLLKLVPDLADAEAARWLAERSRQPFATAEDFLGCVSPNDRVRERLQMDGPKQSLLVPTTREHDDAGG
ncbi:MAG TPA: hypothetical protein VMV94_10560 [Phycisphaerae bacterium]|nr:hypothetical protein [Phycisphaerae bacterium]